MADERPTTEKLPPAEQGQDFVFLSEARPLLVRMHVRIDGKSLQEASEAFLKYMFAYLDVDGDGVLSKAEAERTPTIRHVMSGGINAGGRRGDKSSPTASVADLDSDKDGKVTPAELNTYYRKNGFVAFQFTSGSGGANPLGIAAAFLGGPRGDPPVAAVSEAIFALLDTDNDGKLTREELAAAPSVLQKLDEDEDEIVTARETAPNAGAAAGNPFAMLGNPREGANLPKNLVPVAVPGETPAKLVLSLQERYGKGDKPADRKLTRKDLGLDEAAFTALDSNSDGTLDAQELAAFTKRAPDLEVVLRLGKKDAAQATFEVLKTKDLPSSLIDKIKVTEGVALLDLGLARIDLRGQEDDRADYLSPFIREQALGQFRAADANGDGHVDEAEAKGNRLLRNIFKMVDRDGDGKITEKEFVAFVDATREQQQRGQASCVTLTVTDQSRGLFDLLDTNRDGRLSVREIRRAPALLASLRCQEKGNITREDIPRSHQLATRRGVPDAGGDAAAFAALYLGPTTSYQQPAPTAGPLWFRKMDRNRDGDVSRKEWLFSEAEFRRIDTDGDGLISPDEAAQADKQGRNE